MSAFSSQCGTQCSAVWRRPPGWCRLLGWLAGGAAFLCTIGGEEVEVNIGRFGPYVRYGSNFVSLKKDDDPYTIDLARAIDALAG